MDKFQCNTCGKISTDKNEICEAKSEVGAVYMCHDCGSKGSQAEGICNPVKMMPSYFAAHAERLPLKNALCVDPLTCRF